MTEPPSRARTFGPSAIATPANALTAGRLIAAPVFAVLVVMIGPRSWWLWALWVVLAFSDALDGHLARRLGTTSSGAFLDPLADKFLVIGALAALVDLHAFSWVPVVIIAAREVAMSLFRTRASRLEISVPARSSAKWKTLSQEVAIGFAFFPLFRSELAIAAPTALWVAVGLTLYTGAEYFVDGRRLVAAARSMPAGAKVQERNAR